jgi:hypothetical protein
MFLPLFLRWPWSLTHSSCLLGSQNYFLGFCKIPPLPSTFQGFCQLELLDVNEVTFPKNGERTFEALITMSPLLKLLKLCFQCLRVMRMGTFIVSGPFKHPKWSTWILDLSMTMDGTSSTFQQLLKHKSHLKVHR